MAYEKGGTSVLTSHNFVSYYDAHKPDIADKNVQRYGTETMLGFLELSGAKKETTSIQYSRFEKDRRYPKVKASNGGAGAAGASVSFTLAAASDTTFGSYSPYDTGVSTTTKGDPVRIGDLLMLKPGGSTTASAGNYIIAMVDSVVANTSFVCTPVNSANAIPSIAAAEEIIIIGNGHGEGSGMPAPLSTKSTKYTENLQIIKHRYEVTGTEKEQTKWFTNDDRGSGQFGMLPGEADAYITVMNIIDRNLMVGEALANTAIAEDYLDGTIETDAPLALANGVITQVLDGGNPLNYAGVASISLDDVRDYNVTIDKQNADKENFLFNGINLDQDLDVTLGDRVQNGGISYGAFNFDQDKAIALNFSKFRLGSYTYTKRVMDAFNDIQTLGAEGYGFPYEAMMIPMGMARVAGGSEGGTNVSNLRKRYLKNREMEVTYFDGMKHSDNGNDRCEVRYQSHVGVELQAKNMAGYWKRV
jgi:hypothetical protein